MIILDPESERIHDTLRLNPAQVAVTMRLVLHPFVFESSLLERVILQVSYQTTLVHITQILPDPIVEVAAWSTAPVGLEENEWAEHNLSVFVFQNSQHSDMQEPCNALRASADFQHPQPNVS